MSCLDFAYYDIRKDGSHTPPEPPPHTHHLPPNNTLVDMRTHVFRPVTSFDYFTQPASPLPQDAEKTSPPPLTLTEPATTLAASRPGGEQEQSAGKGTRFQAWFGLVMIVMLTSVGGMNWLTFAVVSTKSTEFLQVSFTAVNWLSNASSIVYVIMSLFTGWYYDRFGIKSALVLAGILCTIGCSIRYMATYLTEVGFRYAAIMIGQLLATAVNPLGLNLTTKYAVSWFTAKERVTANMVATLPIGMSASLILIPYLTPSQDRIPFMLLVLALTSLAVTIPTFFLAKHPPTGMSVTSCAPRLPFWQGLRSLARNMNFWLLVFLFSVNMGLNTAFTSLINQFLVPYGYTDQQAGVIGFILIGSGALGMIILSPIVDRTGAHKQFLKLFTPFLALTYIGFCWTIAPNNFWPIAVVAALNGISSMTLMPISLELGVECTYPCSESVSTSILWLVSQIFAIVLLAIEDSLREPNGTPPNNLAAALTFQAFVASSTGILVFLYSARNLRMEQDRGQTGGDEESEKERKTSDASAGSADTDTTLAEGANMARGEVARGRVASRDRYNGDHGVIEVRRV
ncbi:uncharacterized protein VTP21DRAFT_3311 [Calcarisporiella thermophila]|uniref:uncharacterized protein n=1 Tax=Calcarisporiella thermophila TaxID=911321 RepID=UPI0037449E1D